MSTARETYEHFYFQVIDFERHYSFGIDEDKRSSDAFSEYLHLSLTATLLSNHRLRNEHFQIYLVGDTDLNISHTAWDKSKPGGIGGLHMRKNNMTANIGLPERQIAMLWNAVSDRNHMPYICISTRKIARSRRLVTRIAFTDKVDLNDV